MIRKILFVLAAAVLLLTACTASAQKDRTPWEGQGFLWSIRADAATLGVPEDTRWPVYAAPFESAFRGADGRAEVSAREPFWILGAAGDWRMVYYHVSGGAGRAGWARMPGAPRQGERDNFYSGGGLFRLKRDADLTDDPWGKGRIVARLHQGDTVMGLTRLESGLLYAQTEADGKAAWLFMDESAAEEVPLSHLEDGTLYVHEGVQWLGWEAAVWMGGDDDDMAFPDIPPEEWGLRLQGLDLYGEVYGDLWADEGETEDDPPEPEEVRRVVLPSTLRVLGGEAICFGSAEELVLPDSLTFVSDAAFYGAAFGQITFPPDLSVWNTNCFDRCTVKSYLVLPGNGHYSSRDGVLFSFDGTVLLHYPDGRDALHYDVPSGVREIADRAFYSDMMSIPLKTLSLPIGLQKIGRYAFAGCGRLMSLTVPLTVTNLSPDAFSSCVSLERLSLPPGLTAELDANWAKPGDYTYFNGDNGTTWTAHPPRDPL